MIARKVLSAVYTHKGHKRPKRLRTVFVYAATTMFALAMGLPVFWMISVSIRPLGETFTASLIPSELNLAAYHRILSDESLLIPFHNSLFVATSATLLAMILGVPAAYALTRHKFRGNNMILGFMLSTKMFPPVLLTLSYFFLMSRLGLYDNLLTVILMDTVVILPFVLWIMRSYFETIPRELDEAAIIDGASILVTLLRVILPLSVPGLAATAVYGFVLTWNEFLFAFTFTQSPENLVVPVQIVSYLGQYFTDYPTLLALSVLFTVPILVLFVLMQRYLIKGLAAGAIR